MAAKTDFTDAVFNVASGGETSPRGLAELLLKVMESDLRPEYGPERKANGVPRRLADISRAKKLLGLEPSICLEEGLRGLVDWWRKMRAIAQG